MAGKWLPEKGPVVSGRYTQGGSGDPPIHRPLDEMWPEGARPFLLACRLSTGGERMVYVEWFARSEPEAEQTFLDYLGRTTYLLMDRPFPGIGGEDSPGRYFNKSVLIDWWTVLCGPTLGDPGAE